MNKRLKPMFALAFVYELPVEALDTGIPRRLTRLNQFQLNTVITCESFQFSKMSTRLEEKRLIASLLGRTEEPATAVVPP